MTISYQLERIIRVLDEINNTKSTGYGMTIEDKVEFISKQLKTMAENGFGQLPVHIASSDDYDHETGEPTIDSPEENVFYLVPTGEDSDDMFEEWVYTNGKWEHFGAGGSVQIPQSDWAQTNTNVTDYIKNKPAINAGEGNYSIQEGYGTTASNAQSHAEGAGTRASGQASHAEGAGTIAGGAQSHAEGQNTTASVEQSHAEGYNTTASGTASHAEGYGTTAGGARSHAEGQNTIAGGIAAHAEGYGTKANVEQSHAEGQNTTASGQASHAEGNGTTAGGAQSHAEGADTKASGAQSHAEGYGTTASNAQSHAEGNGTTASGDHQHVFGRYNINDVSTPEEGEDPVALNTYVEIVGNGSYDSTSEETTYSNARTLDWSGNEWLSGNLTAAGGSITIGSTTITEAQLQALLATLS